MLQSQYRDNAINPRRIGSINLENTGMRVTASHHAEVEHAGELNVVKEPSPPNQEAGILLPPD